MSAMSWEAGNLPPSHMSDFTPKDPWLLAPTPSRGSPKAEGRSAKAWARGQCAWTAGYGLAGLLRGRWRRKENAPQVLTSATGRGAAGGRGGGERVPQRPGDQRQTADVRSPGPTGRSCRLRGAWRLCQSGSVPRGPASTQGARVCMGQGLEAWASGSAGRVVAGFARFGAKDPESGALLG